MFITLWRRPTYIENTPGPLSYDSCHCYAQKAKGNKDLIPDQLSFDRILDGQTLSPASLHDFMEYLLYVSRSAENLQFLLWLNDYIKRFNALPQSETSLSPEWRPRRIETQDGQKIQTQSKALSEHKLMPVCISTESFGTDHTMSEDQVHDQPFRAEVDLVMQHYLKEGAPRELNLCYRTRNDVLQGLRTTTHPSVFKSCRDLVEQYLRHQSHPNFVRWALTNGRQPRTIMLRPLCTTTLLTFVASEILLILSGQSRWLRIAMSPILLAGLIQLQCMFHGLCVLLFISGEREMRPWEMFANDEEIKETEVIGLPQAARLAPTKSSHEALSLHSDQSIVSTESAKSGPRFLSKLNPFGPRNTFEHEFWNKQWNTTPWLRKCGLTFTCKKVSQIDPAVKRCQSRIMVQSLLIGLLVTMLVTAGVVAIPVVDVF